MKRLVPTSFFGQLMLGTLVVQTLFLGLFIWYTIVHQRTLADVRTRERIHQQMDLLAPVCGAGLQRGDVAAVRAAMNLSLISTTIRVARLTDLNGTTLAVSDAGKGSELTAAERAELGRAAAPGGVTASSLFPAGNGGLEGVARVEEQGRPVALLWLEPSQPGAVRTVDAVVRVALSYGGFALLANILPIFLIVRTMTRPLHRLRVATTRLMRKPEFSGAFPLPVTTRNEAGQLTVSFNRMVQALEEQGRGLLETLALLDSLLSNAPIGFAFFDRELRYVRVNEFLASQHDLPVAAHLGRQPREIYAKAVGEAKETCLRQVFETGMAIRDVELSDEMADASGRLRSWLMHFYPVRTSEGEMLWVGVIVVDITDQRRSEEALRRTEKLAAAGRLAASIAHEINNPLEAVTNLLYLLQTHDGLDAEGLRLVTTAEAELARVSEITQQTLRFYRQSTFPAPVNVVEVLKSIEGLFHPRLVNAGVRLVKKFRGEPEVVALGGELRQLFANLIGNALDAMPGGGTLRLAVHRGHGRAADGEWVEGVRVSVMDDGSGMSEATRRRIFEAFFTTKEATGTGLGLWVSEEIVRKHGGTMRVRSRQGVGSGTGFVVFLPERVVEAGGRGQGVPGA